MCFASCCCPVAAVPVFGSVVLASIVVVVPEVPWVGRVDGFTTAWADDGAFANLGRPFPA